jgi:hypothetical protein
MKTLKFSLYTLCFFYGLRCFSQQPFTAGNIVVSRIDGGGSVIPFNKAMPLFLDEYTPNGVLVQSIAMPTVAAGSNNPLSVVVNSNGRSEGNINLSTDGKYIVFPGRNTVPGGGTASSASVIGLIDFNGKVNTSTAITDFTEGNHQPITAISEDGSRFWFGGFKAIRYSTVGSSTSVLLAANTSGFMNDFSIADNQLYTSCTFAPASIRKVGTGLPVTTGQSLTSLPGLNTASLIPVQFEFADLDPNVAGVDVLYIADQGTPGGILKFSLVGGSWVSNGNIGGSADIYAGLTLRTIGNTVTIFATRAGSNSFAVRGGQLVKIVDNSGYNGTLTATPTVIASAPATDVISFRGVARAPLGCPIVSSLRVPDISSNQANILWNVPGNGGGNYEYAITTSTTAPSSGTVTSNTFATANGLTNNTTHYVYVRTKCSALSTSEWAVVSFTTGCKAPAAPLVNVSIDNAGLMVAKWNKVFGAASYEYLISTSVNAPNSGTAINDTSVSSSTLNSVTQYYLHVRSNCGGGAFSPWVTKAFSTGCFMPSPNLTTLTNIPWVKWNKIPNASKYEYALRFTPAKPVSGSYTTDTTYTINKVAEGTAYYFHIRAVCNTGAVSQWNTIVMNIQGLQVYPNPVKDVLTIQLNGVSNASGEVLIGDALGRIVTRLQLNNNKTTINTEAWAPGIYLVRYNDGTNKYSVRVLKQ